MYRAANKLLVKITRLQLVYAPFDTAITLVYYHGNLKGNNIRYQLPANV